MNPPKLLQERGITRYQYSLKRLLNIRVPTMPEIEAKEMPVDSTVESRVIPEIIAIYVPTGKISAIGYEYEYCGIE